MEAKSLVFLAIINPAFAGFLFGASEGNLPRLSARRSLTSVWAPPHACLPAGRVIRAQFAHNIAPAFDTLHKQDHLLASPYKLKSAPLGTF